jgi:hypothetical protein
LGTVGVTFPEEDKPLMKARHVVMNFSGMCEEAEEARGREGGRRLKRDGRGTKEEREAVDEGKE